MEKDNKTTFMHEDMCFKFTKTEKGLWQSIFNTINCGIDPMGTVPFPNFQLTVAGRPYGFKPALSTGYTSLPSEFNVQSFENNLEFVKIVYYHESLGLSVTVSMGFIEDTNVVRTHTSICNNGSEPIVLTHLSSMCINGIAADGTRPWFDKDKIKVHYCVQTWEGEAQWRSNALDELGLYPNEAHPSPASIHFSSVGSWSTGRYLPMAVIEDMETGKVWYFQIETSTGWHFEIGHRGALDNYRKGGLFIHSDGADERFGSWSKRLLPGETFTSVPAAFGCCTGGFGEAIKELTKYRRKVLKPQNAWERDCPVIFNDYMNCLWGDPTKEKLLPLIDAAAKVGAEAFCIDAGWFGPKDASWGKGLGDWYPSTDRFGQEGLQGIVQYIKLKGLIPGVWLEMEVCGEDASLGRKPDAWFLMRNGARVGGGKRWFLNFRNTEVREYMHSVIDRLIAMGIGFIKNDYNLCIGNGDDSEGDSAADGLISHSRAFYSFIDEVRQKHPELIIENCGSGAMRSDYGILSHFHIQSSSDQEIYYNNPSILAGSLAGILPEQLGIWAYPYPLLYADRDHPEVLVKENYRSKMKDGEQTIFNMINGLCGNMYLSGHIEKADEYNTALIIEAVELYKKERKHIHNSYPVWPIGFTKMTDKNSWVCVGLVNEENTRVLLSVWRLGSGDEYIELPIPKWNGVNAKVKQLYPSEGHEVNTSYNPLKGSLTVYMPNTYTARHFEIKAI